MINKTALRICELITDDTPKFAIEFGALDGVRSNIKPLLKDGWPGLWIEPSIESFNKLEKVAKNFNVETLNIAISDFDGEATFYYHVDHPGGSSLIHPDNRKFGNPAKNKRNNTYVVPCKRLITVLGEKKVGVMSMDAEDMDTKILEDMIKTNIRPHIVVAEGRGKEAQAKQLDIMKNDYDFIELIEGSNSIFTKKQ